MTSSNVSDPRINFLIILLVLQKKNRNDRLTKGTTITSVRSVRQFNMLIVIEWILLTVSKIENCRKQRNDLNLKKEELQENCVVFFFHFSKNWVTIIETKHSGKKWQKVKTFLRKMYQCYTHLYLYFSFILQNRKKYCITLLINFIGILCSQTKEK